MRMTFKKLFPGVLVAALALTACQAGSPARPAPLPVLRQMVGDLQIAPQTIAEVGGIPGLIGFNGHTAFSTPVLVSQPLPPVVVTQPPPVEAPTPEPVTTPVAVVPPVETPEPATAPVTVVPPVTTPEPATAPVTVVPPVTTPEPATPPVAVVPPAATPEATTTTSAGG